MEILNKIFKFINSRFSLFILGIILIILYYLNNESHVTIFYFGLAFIIIGLLVINRYNRSKLYKNNISSSVNGIGTTLYGKREINSNGSYIATKWFIFFLLPIFPIGSYRVLPSTPKITSPVEQTTAYSIFEKVSLNKKQVINTYLLVYGFIFVIFILPMILF